MQRHMLWVLLVVLFVAILTNPSESSFRNYIRDHLLEPKMDSIQLPRAAKAETGFQMGGYREGMMADKQKQTKTETEVEMEREIEMEKVAEEQREREKKKQVEQNSDCGSASASCHENGDENDSDRERTLRGRGRPSSGTERIISRYDDDGEPLDVCGDDDSNFLSSSSSFSSGSESGSRSRDSRPTSCAAVSSMRCNEGVCLDHEGAFRLALLWLNLPLKNFLAIRPRPLLNHVQAKRFLLHFTGTDYLFFTHVRLLAVSKNQSIRDTDTRTDTATDQKGSYIKNQDKDNRNIPREDELRLQAVEHLGISSTDSIAFIGIFRVWLPLPQLGALIPIYWDTIHSAFSKSNFAISLPKGLKNFVYQTNLKTHWRDKLLPERPLELISTFYLLVSLMWVLFPTRTRRGVVLSWENIRPQSQANVVHPAPHPPRPPPHHMQHHPAAQPQTQQRIVVPPLQSQQQQHQQQQPNERDRQPESRLRTDHLGNHHQDQPGHRLTQQEQQPHHHQQQQHDRNNIQRHPHTPSSHDSAQGNSSQQQQLNGHSDNAFLQAARHSSPPQGQHNYFPFPSFDSLQSYIPHHVTDWWQLHYHRFPNPPYNLSRSLSRYTAARGIRAWSRYTCLVACHFSHCSWVHLLKDLLILHTVGPVLLKMLGKSYFYGVLLTGAGMGNALTILNQSKFGSAATGCKGSSAFIYALLSASCLQLPASKTIPLRAPIFYDVLGDVSSSAGWKIRPFEAMLANVAADFILGNMHWYGIDYAINAGGALGAWLFCEFGM